MKVDEKLTKKGKLRKNRKIAVQAIKNYDLYQPKLKLVTYTGNITYRVKTNDQKTLNENLYVVNCYSLRLHQPNYQTKTMIESELEWLSELSNAGVPVPKPVISKNGELSIEIDVVGAPPRRCSLLRGSRVKCKTSSSVAYEINGKANRASPQQRIKLETICQFFAKTL